MQFGSVMSKYFCSTLLMSSDFSAADFSGSRQIELGWSTCQTQMVQRGKSTELSVDLENTINAYKLQDQLFKQLFVSTECVWYSWLSLSERKHNHLLQRANCSGFLINRKSPKKANLKWLRSCWNSGVSIHTKDKVKKYSVSCTLLW